MESESAGDRLDFTNSKEQNVDYKYVKPKQRERRSYKIPHPGQHKYRYETSATRRVHADELNRITPENQDTRADPLRLEIQTSTFTAGDLSDSVSVARSNPLSSVTGSEHVSKRSRGGSNCSDFEKRKEKGGGDAVMVESTPASHASKVALCVLVSILVGCGVGAGVGYGVFSIIADNSSEAPESGNINGQEGGSANNPFQSTNSNIQPNSQNPSSKNSSSSSTTTQKTVVEGKKLINKNFKCYFL